MIWKNGVLILIAVLLILSAIFAYKDIRRSAQLRDIAMHCVETLEDVVELVEEQPQQRTTTPRR